MSLLTENGNTKDDLRLPTDDNLLSQVYHKDSLSFCSHFYTYNPFFCLLIKFCVYTCLQIKDGFAEGKDLVVTVMSAMGEEQISALKDIGPKNWIYYAIALFSDSFTNYACVQETLIQMVF